MMTIAGAGRSSLGDDAYELAWAAGRQLTVDEAFDLALGNAAEPR